MNTQDILDMIGDARDRYVWDARRVREDKHFVSKRKLAIILLAATMVLLLVSCGVTAVIYGDSIQDWFTQYWADITGQDMQEAQTAVISKLSQEIGVSATDGELEVTVDSATGSETIFYILLRVEGYPFGQRQIYGFEKKNLTADPAAMPENLAVSSFGVRYLGIDENGAGLFLVDYDFSASGEDAGMSAQLPITLELQNMTRRGRHESHKKEKTAVEGNWTLSFTLDRSRLPEKWELPDAEVTGRRRDTGENVPLMLTDLVLSNTGIRFSYDSDNSNTELFGGITVLLKDGTRIVDGQGTGVMEEDLTTRSYEWHWPIPLNMEDIVSVTISTTEIFISAPDAEGLP